MNTNQGLIESLTNHLIAIRESERWQDYFYNDRTGMSLYDDVWKDDHYAEHKQRFIQLVFMKPAQYIILCAKGFNRPAAVIYKQRQDTGLKKLEDKFGSTLLDCPMIAYQVDSNGRVSSGSQEGLHRAILAMKYKIPMIPVAICCYAKYNEDVDNIIIKKVLNTICNKFSKYA